ncbi:hypothetical protein ACFPOD_16055 [Nitratireductor kimnyeongensis]|uniref:Uncharacterized protein n=1 Tax=Nitratireductor kimnyeongensis TaxID=430679 RepID=A0ABW0TB17_9HYPH|nr:hypothetical protein [Nitratireductor kimnyeongensis]QZZ37147.1 hypothetical protein KW403_08540 [Nitratireductor kimnyeongensis]
MSSEDIRTLLANAERLRREDIAELCSIELEKRSPKRTRRVGSVNKGYVAGYHFVCADERGVTVDAPNRFRSKSWVVAEHRVIDSIRHGAYLALHESRNEPSYRQGKIVGYELTDREFMGKHNTGIEFIVEADDRKREWVGDGTGEKGYLWSDNMTITEDSEDKGAPQ